MQSFKRAEGWARWLGLLILLGGAGRAAPAGAALGAAAPAGSALARVGKLTLSNDLYSGLYSSAYDPLHGYAYFATAHAINPGWVIKVDVNGALPVEVGATHAITGEANLDAAALDPAAGYGYWASPNGHVLKFALGAGAALPTYLGSGTLLPGETNVLGMVIDTRDPDPANHFLYVSTNTNPANIVKVAPGAGNSPPYRLSALSPVTGTDHLRRGVIDLSQGYAYFATVTGLPRVVKLGLTPGSNPPTYLGLTSLGLTATHSIGSGVIDLAAGYAYWGTYDASLPAKVYKMALGAGSAPPAPAGEVTLHAGERELSTAAIDPAAGLAYFGTDHTYPGKIYQITLGVGAAAPTETGELTLQGGTQPNPPDGVNVLNSPETLYGEVFLQSSVIDLARGFAYFGTDSTKGQVVKVDLPGHPRLFLPLVARP